MMVCFLPAQKMENKVLDIELAADAMERMYAIFDAHWDEWSPEEKAHAWRTMENTNMLAGYIVSKVNQ
jgi:hypothetical protein